MSTCATCGKAVRDGASFCAACGAPQGATEVQSRHTPPPTPPVEPATVGTDTDEPSGLRAGPSDDPDKYELLEVRSRGGEGQLWRATLFVDSVPITVAVKVINEANADRIEDWSQRWKQQAEILKTLDHPSLVKVRDTFEGPVPHAPGAADPTTRSLFLIMNWVEGESLVEWVARNPERDLLDTVPVIARVAAAVDYLHSGASTGTPVLHRDIKPANVLIDGTKVSLVDFGFARLMSGEPMTLVGTPFYLAPEVVGGGTSSEASDRYSLGATAYYTIVGEPPTPGDLPSMRAKLAAVRGAEGRHDLADHVLAMLDPDPSKRPTNTVEWAQALAAGAVSASLPDRQAAPVPAAAGAGGSPPGRKGRRKLIMVLGIIAAVLILGGAAYAYGVTRGSDTPKSAPVAAVSASPNVVVEQDASTNAIDSGSPSPSPDGSPAAQGSDGASGPDSAAAGRTVMNISEYLQPVSGEIQTGKATMKTRDYEFSLYGEQDLGWDENVSELTVEYNVPKGFDMFIATVGMDDQSPSAARTTFQVTNAITGRYLFGSRSKPVVVKLNQVRRVEIRLPEGTLRIKLTAFCNDGGSGSYVYPVWGDARFTGPSDQATLPQPEE